MSSQVETLVNREYKHGWVTDIESDVAPPGLSEDVVRLISAKKREPEWLLEWRLKAYRGWLKMTEPHSWPNIRYTPVDYQSISYYSAPRTTKPLGSLDEVDPKLLETYKKLGIPLSEQKILAGVAVDAIFDSVSVGTTYKAKLAEQGIIFCSFGEAVQEHPELVRKYLGSVVPASDNFFAALNAAVFSDGSFVYVPKGVRCPMELSTYFRINAAAYRPVRAHPHRGRRGRVRELSRGLHRAQAGREPAPRRGGRAGGARRRHHQVLHGAELVRRRRGGEGRDLQLRHQARQVRRGPLQDLLDPGRDRLGDHLEVPQRHPPGRRLGGRVLLGGGGERPCSRPTPAPR